MLTFHEKYSINNILDWLLEVLDCTKRLHEVIEGTSFTCVFALPKIDHM